MLFLVVKCLVFLGVPSLLLFGGVPMVYAQGIEIIFLIDNNSCDDRLKRQWGLSCLVRGIERTILFDTGPSGSALLHNMEKLGIEPAEVGVVVISHKHQDHTGGLDAFLKANGAVTVYLLESFPPSLSRQVNSLGAQVVTVREPTKICDHVFTTG